MSYITRMEEKLVECPFNKSHKVREGGLQYHIVRCMKNYPHHVVCPYNAIHRLEKKDLKNHILNCPNKGLMHPDKLTGFCQTQHGDVSDMPLHVGDYSWNTREEDWSTN